MVEHGNHDSNKSRKIIREQKENTKKCSGTTEQDQRISLLSKAHTNLQQARTLISHQATTEDNNIRHMTSCQPYPCILNQHTLNYETDLQLPALVKVLCQWPTNSMSSMCNLNLRNKKTQECRPSREKVESICIYIYIWDNGYYYGASKCHMRQNIRKL